MNKNLYIIAGCNGAGKTLKSELNILNPIKFDKLKEQYNEYI